MTFPTLAGSNTSSVAVASTSHPVALPASVGAGDLLIIISALSGGGSFSGLDGFTSLLTPSGVAGQVLYKVATGSEGGFANLTTLATRTSASGSYRITGYSSSPEGAKTDFTSGTNPDPPSLTPSWGALDTLWIAGCIVTGSGNPAVSAYPASYTNTITVGVESGANDQCIGAATRQVNASSQDPGTFTLSPVGATVTAVTVAVKPFVPSVGRSFGFIFG